MASVDPLEFWGKAQPKDPSGPAWHPLVFHCLDVAAVGWQLLQKDRALCGRLGDLIGLEEAEITRLVPYLLAMHDIGKFATKPGKKHALNKQYALLSQLHLLTRV